jgi:hypothetical protein
MSNKFAHLPKVTAHYTPDPEAFSLKTINNWRKQQAKAVSVQKGEF